MRTGRAAVGVVGIDSDRPGPLLTPAQRRLLDALTDQAALAIERVRLVDDVDRAKRTMETERLRAALLTSLSHDLKTPLAAILGAAGMLRELTAKLSPSDREELVSTIIGESERLNRFIANLLDMTKLESGAVAPKTAPHELGEIVAAAIKRAGTVLASHRIDVDLPGDNPLVRVDDVLLEQVLFNLLDNAAKYAPADTTIRIRAWREGSSVLLQVLDEGPGIPPGDLERIFDKFYRVQKADHVRAGTGLGLAISRGFVESMHGSITAGNRTDRSGAVFTIALPVVPANAMEPVA
jgi:two-component system sensor histidine kinase KdpD